MPMRLAKDGMKYALLSLNALTKPRDAMVKAKLDGHRKKQRVASPNSARAKELPTTHWIYAMAMIAEKNKPVKQESKKELPEDFSASDFDVVRARALSSHI